MEQFIYKVGILCIFTMITGILIDLGCFPATEKIIKFIAAAYIVVSAVASFKSVQFDFELNNYDRQLTYELNTDVVKYKIIEETETKLENIIKNRLDEKNISYNAVYLHILEQNDNMEWLFGKTRDFIEKFITGEPG